MWLSFFFLDLGLFSISILNAISSSPYTQRSLFTNSMCFALSQTVLLESILFSQSVYLFCYFFTWFLSAFTTPVKAFLNAAASCVLLLLRQLNFYSPSLGNPYLTSTAFLFIFILTLELVVESVTMSSFLLSIYCFVFT